MFVEAVVALSFFYALIKLDKNINRSQERLKEETFRQSRLHKILDSIENEQVIFDRVKTVIQIDSLPTITIEQHQVNKDRKIKIGPDTAHSSGSKLVNPVVILLPDLRQPQAAKGIAKFEYNFTTPVHIGKGIDIVELSGVFVVRYSAAKVPEDMWVRIVMKESDKESGNIAREIDLRLVKQMVSADSSINCIFREAPKPALNEFGLPEYQRKLSIALTGKLKNSTIDGLLAWEEISSRPAWAKIKIPLVSK